MISLLLLLIQDPPVRFEGAKEIGEGELRRTIEPDLERWRKSPRLSILDDAAFRLAAEYRERGFPFVEVSFERAGGTIVFRIAEGARVLLGRLHFVGNASIPDEEFESSGLGELLRGRPPYSRRLLGVLVNRILAAYHARGFIEAAVEEPLPRYDPEDRRMNVTFVIREGRTYVLDGFRGLPDEIFDAVRRLVGQSYTPRTAGLVEAAVIDHRRENGRPFAKARAIPILDRGKGTVTLSIVDDPGPLARISAVRVRGAKRARESFILWRAGLRTGELYRESDLRAAEDRLRRTGLFETVTISPARYQEKWFELELDLVVEERDPGEIAVSAGYASLDGPRAGAEVGYSNLFGGGELVRAKGTIDRFGGRAAFEAAWPYALGTEFRLSGTAYYEDRRYPSFDASSFGGGLDVFYPLLEELHARGGARHAVVRTDDVEEEVPPGDVLDFEYTAVSLSITWDRRDHPALPTRGFQLSALVEWAPRAISDDIQFVQTSGQFRTYVPLPFDCVLAGSVQAGMIEPLDDTDEIPIALRYFAGGSGTVRGFEFGQIGPRAGGEPTGGEVFLSLQLELRFPIWGDLHGAVFTDRGGVWFAREEVDLDDLRYSVGFGLRYYTVAGAIVADLAWNPSREDEEEAVEFHFSVGFPF